MLNDSEDEQEIIQRVAAVDVGDAALTSTAHPAMSHDSGRLCLAFSAAPSIDPRHR